jgi:hypothetical protein
MKKNVNSVDKFVRIVLALILAALIITGTISGTAGIILGILAVVFLATGVISFCPIYKVLGISTLNEKPKSA